MSNLAGMVLAAGPGSRLAQEEKPKALVEVGGKAFVQIALERLRGAGGKNLFVNLHHGAAEIAAFLSTQMADVQPLQEPELLDTGGGIAAALPHLGAFFLISTCDGIWRDEAKAASALAAMVEKFNPRREDGVLLLAHKARSYGCGAGDFSLTAAGLPSREGARDFVYSGAALLSAGFFEGEKAGAGFPLAPLLFAAAQKNRLGAYVLADDFFHAGTPEGLDAARTILAKEA